MDVDPPHVRQAPAHGRRGAAPRASGEDMELRAREYLALLGRQDHPAAEDDPLRALFEVAVDYDCTARGYRGLYERLRERQP